MKVSADSNGTRTVSKSNVKMTCALFIKLNTTLPQYSTPVTSFSDSLPNQAWNFSTSYYYILKTAWFCRKIHQFNLVIHLKKKCNNIVKHELAMNVDTFTLTVWVMQTLKTPENS